MEDWKMKSELTFVRGFELLFFRSVQIDMSCLGIKKLEFQHIIIFWLSVFTMKALTFQIIIILE